MSNTHAVVWSEGLFLRPQHFQQHNRFVEQQWLNQVRLHSDYGYGIHKLAMDAELLKKGQLVVTACEGIMPDGTAFVFPGSDGDVLVADLTAVRGETMVRLALPRRRALGRLIGDNGSKSTHRYRSVSIEMEDITRDDSDPVTVDVAVPNFALKWGKDALEEWVSLPIARVQEVREEGELILDTRFIPTCLSIQASPVLQSALREVSALLTQRRKKLLQRISGIDEYGVAGITELLLLQVINRYEPLFEHYRKLERLHPERLYQYLLGLTAELATFTRANRSYDSAPAYNHHQLQATFEALLSDLRDALNYVFDESALRLPLKAYKYGLHIVSLQEHKVLQYKRFILAVRAEMPSEELRQLFPAHIKLGPAEKIKDLVNLQLPGIGLSTLPVAPRQIPYHSEFVYFELNTHSELWSALEQSSGLALHVGRNFPGMQLELWAIRG